MEIFFSLSLCQYSISFKFLDIPKDSCEYVHARDCKVPTPGCVVSAIYNYTERVNHQTFQQAKDALRFVIHLIGDIHQPLHVGRSGDLGGNTINVNFFGRNSNLHAVWDGAIIQRRVTLDFSGDENKFYTYLTDKLKQEPWRSKISEWQSCHRVSPKPCPEQWAIESAVFACRYAYDGAVNNTQLTEAYFKRAVPVVEEAIVKGGVRLAAVLNNAFK